MKWRSQLEQRAHPSPKLLHDPKIERAAKACKLAEREIRNAVAANLIGYCMFKPIP